MKLLSPDQILEKFPNSEYQEILWISNSIWRQIVVDLEKRIRDLEDQSKKKPRQTTATKGQIILLMEKLNMLSGLIDQPITIKNKARILSRITGLAPDNIESDLSNINNKASDLRIESNYKYVIEWLNEVGLKDEAKKAEAELEEIKGKRKEKSPSSNK